jgi:hypothetical protein
MPDLISGVLHAFDAHCAGEISLAAGQSKRISPVSNSCFDCRCLIQSSASVKKKTRNHTTNQFRVASAAVRLKTWKIERKTALEVRPSWGALKAFFRGHPSA